MTRSSARLLAISLAMLVAITSLPETALGRGGGGKSGSHAGKGHSGKGHAGHHSRFRAGVAVFGAGALWPWWYYGGSGAAYGTQYAAPAIEYVERSQDENPADGSWLYCAKAQAYFPYVGECADGWESVPATPPGATSDLPTRADSASQRDAAAEPKPGARP